MTAPPETWIFAYGSLMWDPGFPHLEAQPATVHGYHRAFCLYSHHHRGTEEKPGLVLGLDLGGSCLGRAYRVAAGEREAVLAYLHEREMLHYVYDPRTVTARLADGRRVPARAYVVDRASSQYAANLAPEEAARLILQGRGISGPNVEYLENTVRHLDELGIGDGPLHALWEIVRGGS